MEHRHPAPPCALNPDSFRVLKDTLEGAHARGDHQAVARLSATAKNACSPEQLALLVALVVPVADERGSEGARERETRQDAPVASLTLSLSRSLALSPEPLVLDWERILWFAHERCLRYDEPRGEAIKASLAVEKALVAKANLLRGVEG